MRHFYLFFIGILLGQYVHCQSWFKSYAPQGRDVSTSAIINGRTWILGGGFEVAEQFEDIFLTNDYAVSGGGWNVMFTDTPTSRVVSITFKDSLNGYGVCYLGKMIKTTDGGNSWSRVDTMANKNFFKVIYVTPQTLYIAGGSRTKDTSTILKSNNGGDTWTTVYNQPGSRLKSIYFLGTLKGFAAGDSSEILTTSDGGGSWTPVSSPVANRSFNGIVFLNSSTGYIIGGTRDTARTTLLKTTDGGQHWLVLKDGPGGQLNDITFINPNEGYIVGDSATVLKTTDGGQNWMPQQMPNTAIDQQINTVSFYNSSSGVIGGNGAYVMFYTFSALPQVSTGGAVLLPDSTGALFASINTHGYPGSYSFVYSTDSSFAPAWGGIYPQPLISDSFVAFQYNTLPLIPDTTYYYYVVAYTLAGSAVGQRKSFFTHLPVYTFQTLGANLVSSTVTLSGSVDKLSSATNLYFE